MKVKQWVLAKVQADATILAIVGSASRIFFSYPDSFENVPLLCYSESNQRQVDQGYSDDVSGAVESTLEWDVYVRGSTSDLADALTSVMSGLFFNLDFSSDIPEPNLKLRHRRCRYRRVVRAEDLI